VHPNFDNVAAEAAALPRHSKVVCRIQIPLRTVTSTDCTARLDWQICSAQSVIMRLKTYAEYSPVNLNVVELCIIHSFHSKIRM